MYMHLYMYLFGHAYINRCLHSLLCAHLLFIVVELEFVIQKNVIVVIVQRDAADSLLLKPHQGCSFHVSQQRPTTRCATLTSQIRHTPYEARDAIADSIGLQLDDVVFLGPDRQMACITMCWLYLHVNDQILCTVATTYTIYAQMRVHATS